ncbi:uncharacterized protein LOC105158385 [Sesamum indicum]|uniref:Uncharacterized protein LOC105158385 n=1 Tax=Sesamum indicum TaxID=4182 RepID=A0A6I9SSZ1_SESIN|nr:uncharacterized protein LOC105158385 [Sesamum indicum]XP_011073434.1 uncharacterized protein LOC105158385 [Sesamum indicum]
MDYNKVQSCEIISSTNMLPRMQATHGAGSSMKPTEFINHGLLLWNQGRRKWTRNKKSVSRILRWRVLKLRTLSLCISRKYCLRSYRTYDSLLSSNRRFPRPIPLGEMVGYLVETWDHGGMYD